MAPPEQSETERSESPRLVGGETLASILVELSDTSVGDFRIADFLQKLVRHCVDQLSVAAVGLLLADEQGVPGLAASSNESARVLGHLEIQVEQGPGLDCFRSGHRILGEHLHLHGLEGRWPSFAAEANAMGLRSVHALPMRYGHQVIGALSLFSAPPDGCDKDCLSAAQAMADITTIGILQERRAREARGLTERLQSALDDRVVIEQAKGVLAERARISVDEALQVLRGYARRHHRTLRSVAEMAVSGRIPRRVDQPPATPQGDPGGRSAVGS